MPGMRNDHQPMKRIFVTGISTEVGKTIVSAILVEALQADYWKPVQAGDLHQTDSHKVASLISNSQSVIHPSSYELNTPMSPHAAAGIDGLTIELGAIIEPDTTNHLVMEGAGGLLVPLNQQHTIVDLIKPGYHVVVVSRHYLGSINHTLLTLEYLKQLEVPVSLIFSGDAHPTTESIIQSKSGVTFLGRVDEEEGFTKDVIKAYAQKFRDQLMAL